MHRMAIVLAVPAALATGPAAAAQGYLGVGAMEWTFAPDFSAEDASASTASMALGVDLNNYLAAEARYAAGGEDSVQAEVSRGASVEAEWSLASLTSLLAKPKVPISDRVQAYGLVGKSEVTMAAESVENDESGRSYGIGLEVRITDGAWLGLEYAELVSDDDFELTATTAGLRSEF